MPTSESMSAVMTCIGKRQENRGGAIGLQDAVVLVYVIGVAVYEIRLRVSVETRARRGDGAGIVDIIGIQPSDDVPRGARQSLIHGIRLSAVAFRDPLE